VDNDFFNSIGQAETIQHVLGFEIFPRARRTPEVLGALVKADAEKWWPIIKELGIKAE
jgi:hypothetical protein